MKARKKMNVTIEWLFFKKYKSVSYINAIMLIWNVIDVFMFTIHKEVSVVVVQFSHWFQSICFTILCSWLFFQISHLECLNKICKLIWKFFLYITTLKSTFLVLTLFFSCAILAYELKHDFSKTSKIK